MERPALSRLWRETQHALLAILAPPHCAACGAPGTELCAACAHRLMRRVPPWCETCGEPLLPEAPCPVDHRRIAGLAAARSAFAYRGAGADLVHRFKFARDAAARHFLIRGLARVAPVLTGSRRRTVLVSVPLHPRKLRRRGFDQAAQLARGLAERARVRFVPGVLRRVRETLPQGDPRVLSRERNVQAAFAVVRPRPVVGASVWLVDDVSTSGATGRACARELLAAGAREVVLLVAAWA